MNDAETYAELETLDSDYESMCKRETLLNAALEELQKEEAHLRRTLADATEPTAQKPSANNTSLDRLKEALFAEDSSEDGSDDESDSSASVQTDVILKQLADATGKDSVNDAPWKQEFLYNWTLSIFF